MQYGEDGGPPSSPYCIMLIDVKIGGHWLVRMEWRPAGWSVCLSLLIFPCTMKFRSSLLTPAHPGDPGERAVKQLWCGVVFDYKHNAVLL